MKPDNGALNDFCAQWDVPGNPKFVIAGLEDSGKVVPYIGWFWRQVDFTDRESIRLGYIPGGFIGFMENNKWDYEEWTPTQEQYDGILLALHVAMANTNDENLQALFEFMQECKPDRELITLEEHRAEEQRQAKQRGDGPCIFMTDAYLNANKETEDECPDCGGKLWTFHAQPQVRICYCGYQKGVDEIVNG